MKTVFSMRAMAEVTRVKGNDSRKQWLVASAWWLEEQIPRFDRDDNSKNRRSFDCALAPIRKRRGSKKKQASAPLRMTN